MTELEVQHLRGRGENNIGWGMLRWQEMVGTDEVWHLLQLLNGIVPLSPAHTTGSLPRIEVIGKTTSFPGRVS